MASDKPRVFVSYSHADEAWKERVVRQLRVLEPEGVLEVWDDREIAGGDDWASAIEAAMASARVALFLVSASFLTSRFIGETEVPRMLARRRGEGLRVIPVILSPCLQHPPGAQTGRLKDPAMQALVQELAVQNPGLCVITTRLPVADVVARAGAVTVDLEKLPPGAGAELLRRLGVDGADRELRKASKEFGGHGLALSLLGTYLRDVCGGDVRRRKEVPLIDEEIAQGGHARRVMVPYEGWFEEGPELRVLRLMGLFDRPADAGALAALRKEPAIPGLTDGLTAGEEARWRKVLARLRQGAVDRAGRWLRWAGRALAGAGALRGAARGGASRACGYGRRDREVAWLEEALAVPAQP